MGRSEPGVPWPAEFKDSAWALINKLVLAEYKAALLSAIPHCGLLPCYSFFPIAFSKRNGSDDSIAVCESCVLQDFHVACGR